MFIDIRERSIARAILDLLQCDREKTYPEKYYVVMYRTDIKDTIHNDNETG